MGGYYPQKTDNQNSQESNGHFPEGFIQKVHFGKLEIFQYLVQALEGFLVSGPLGNGSSRQIILPGLF